MLSSSIRKYLDALPNGAASYPECCVKASVLRQHVNAKPLGPEVDLPPLTRRLVDDPPTVTEWIPEIHFNIAMLAILDVHFDARRLESYHAWSYEQNRKLLGTPLYRMMFLLVTPERLLRGIEKRWGAFRRGTEFRILSATAGRAELCVQSPPFLYTSLSLQRMARAFQAAIDCAGARASHVELASHTSTESVFSLGWQG